MWFLVASAIAAKGGVVSVAASPESEVVLFPRVDAHRIDVGIYDNRVPLDDQLAGLTTRYLQQGWATSIGGGTWFVTLHVEPGIELSWTRQPDRIRFELAPGTPTVVATPPPPSLEELLDDPLPRRSAEPVPLTLHPLRGDASTLMMDPVDAFRLMPKVVTPSVATYRSSLPAIDSYRAVMTQSDEGEVRAAAMARAAVAYSNLGMHRDALYYFRRALDEGRDDAAVALAAARSLVALGKADEARSLCRYAARRSARDEDVLSCLAGVAYIDEDLPASELGRALSEASAHPHRQLIAAQLLQADHRHDEALPILERLVEQGDARVFAALGDALQATGDLPGAIDAWRAASRDRHLQRQMTLRMRMAELVQKGPGEFPAAIPALLAESDRSGLAAAEAHYLLAQISQVYGDTDIAAEQLNLLWNYHPSLAKRSDAPERLVSTCVFRLRQLTEQGRHVDVVAFFDLCWREELDTMVVEPTALTAASRSFASLGLADEALELQLRSMAMLTRVGRDDPRQLAWLSELYQRTYRSPEALQTVAFVRELSDVPADLAESLALTEGDAHLALEDSAAALEAWAQVDTPAARLRQALWLAGEGQCDKALPLLQADDGDAARLASARCLLRLGRADEAAAVIAEAGASDEEARSDAEWLASVAAYDGVEDAEGKGLWERLLAEEQTASSWREQAP